MTWEEFVVLLIVVFLVVMVIGGVVALDDWSRYRHCGTLIGKFPGYNFRWISWTGCIVEVSPGIWVDAEEVHFLYMKVEELREDKR